MGYKAVMRTASSRTGCSCGIAYFCTCFCLLGKPEIIKVVLLTPIAADVTLLGIEAQRVQVPLQYRLT